MSGLQRDGYNLQVNAKGIRVIPPTLMCPWCGAGFTPRGRRQRYCCRAHATAAAEARKESKDGRD